MKATPEPIVSGSSFLPKAPLVCTKRMPALAVMSLKPTLGISTPASATSPEIGLPPQPKLYRAVRIAMSTPARPTQLQRIQQDLQLVNFIRLRERANKRIHVPFGCIA